MVHAHAYTHHTPTPSIASTRLYLTYCGGELAWRGCGRTNVSIDAVGAGSGSKHTAAGWRAGVVGRHRATGTAAGFRMMRTLLYDSTIQTHRYHSIHMPLCTILLAFPVYSGRTLGWGPSAILCFSVDIADFTNLPSLSFPVLHSLYLRLCFSAVGTLVSVHCSCIFRAV